jgi:hypothetical protein
MMIVLAVAVKTNGLDCVANPNLKNRCLEWHQLRQRGQLHGRGIHHRFRSGLRRNRNKRGPGKREPVFRFVHKLLDGELYGSKLLLGRRL